MSNPWRWIKCCSGGVRDVDWHSRHSTSCYVVVAATRDVDRHSTSCRVAVTAVRDVWPEVVYDGITPSHSVARIRRITASQSSSLPAILFLPRSSAVTVSLVAELTAVLPPTFLWSSVTFRLDCRYTIRTLESRFVNTLYSTLGRQGHCSRVLWTLCIRL